MIDFCSLCGFFPISSALTVPRRIMITTIMHQHIRIGYIIGMIIRNLEVIDLDGAFEQLVLDLFKATALSPQMDWSMRGCRTGRQPRLIRSNFKEEILSTHYKQI